MLTVRSYACYWKDSRLLTGQSSILVQVGDGGSVRPADYNQVPVLTKRLHLLRSLSYNNHSDKRNLLSSLRANRESVMSAALMHKSALPEFGDTSWLGVNSALKARGRASGQFALSIPYINLHKVFLLYTLTTVNIYFCLPITIKLELSKD